MSTQVLKSVDNSTEYTAWTSQKVLVSKKNALYKPYLQSQTLLDAHGLSGQALIPQNKQTLYFNEEFTAPEGCEWRELRSLLEVMEESDWTTLAKEFHLLQWRLKQHYCSRCGSPLQNHETEVARFCTSCKMVHYPITSPAVIVAVTRGDEILLVRHARHRETGLYTLVAGFVDAAETLESAVARELFEEVGIRVHSIEYQMSQSWPFPNSLMVGFKAEWESGDIQVDNVEIDAGAWFRKDNLPLLPSKGTLAYKVIQGVLGL